MSQISLHPTSVSKVQSFAHLKKQTLGVQIKIRIVFFPWYIALCCYIYSVHSWSSFHPPSPPPTPTD